MYKDICVYTRYKDNVLCMLLRDSKAIDLMLYPDTDIHLKNVYRGKVKNIVANIGAAFVEVKPGLICFLSLSECKDIVVLNRNREASDLKCGDEILVQITKPAVKSKAPVCSGQIRLPKAVKDEVILQAKTRSVFSVLYSSEPEYLSFLKRFDISTLDKIVCGDETLFEEVDAYLDRLILKESDDSLKDKLGLIRSNTTLYTDSFPIEKLYKIDSLIDEICDKHVWLKSGADIVIEYTEAMTVIDVNTSKSIKDKAKFHVHEVNKEAATEIFRQIRLRNLSGMILIDFINDSEENTEKLTEHVKELADADVGGCKYVDITGLGIVELTRRKSSRPLYEIIKKS